MPRLPYAARTLKRQVEDAYPDAEIEATDLDGLGVHRTLRFDKDTSEELAPLLAPDLAGDSRLAEVRVTDAGYLHVTFSARTNADDPRRFPLEAARDVLEARESAEQDSDEE